MIFFGTDIFWARGRSFVKEKPKQFDQVATADGGEDGLEVDGISMADGDTKLVVANKFVGARPGELLPRNVY